MHTAPLSMCVADCIVSARFQVFGVAFFFFFMDWLQFILHLYPVKSARLHLAALHQEKSFSMAPRLHSTRPPFTFIHYQTLLSTTTYATTDPFSRALEFLGAHITIVGKEQIQSTKKVCMHELQ